jgi:hypothetical protein
MSDGPFTRPGESPRRARPSRAAMLGNANGYQISFYVINPPQPTGMIPHLSPG